MSADATQRIAAAVAALDRGLGLRAATDADRPALRRIVGGAYAEFGCGELWSEGEDADLEAPGTYAAAQGRRWWVVTDPAIEAPSGEPVPRIVASCALGPAGERDGRSTVTLHRLYLEPSVRGGGLATALVRAAADEARRDGADVLVAWSDTRLTAAHARYEVLGFTRASDTRELHDPAGTVEFRFELDLTGRR
jgi:GNAT superfamily N-acetyltransferase